MKFIGDRTHYFNRSLLPLIDNLPYTIVSYMDENYSYKSTDTVIIQLLPIKEFCYFKSVDIAYTEMIRNGFYDTLKTCTSIFIVEPNLIDVKDVAKIIEGFDKNNLIDNIWIYPKPVKNYKLRNNDVEKLPYYTQTK